MESAVPFVACDNPHATPLTVHILAAVAQDEVKRISDRTKAALAAYKARGGKLGSALVGSRLTAESRARGSMEGNIAQSKQAVAEYADLLPIIVTLRSEGLSLQAVADRLNSEGHTTRTGASWSPVQVKRVIDRSGK